jgi:hypothetical protein
MRATAPAYLWPRPRGHWRQLLQPAQPATARQRNTLQASRSHCLLPAQGTCQAARAIYFGGRPPTRPSCARRHWRGGWRGGGGASRPPRSSTASRALLWSACPAWRAMICRWVGAGSGREACRMTRCSLARLLRRAPRRHWSAAARCGAQVRCTLPVAHTRASADVHAPRYCVRQALNRFRLASLG